MAISKEVANSGTQSLKVSSRSKYWNGASVASADFQANKSYDVEAFVYFDGASYTPSAAVSGDIIPLKKAFPEEEYFKLGTAMSDAGAANVSLQKMFLTHFSSVTPENELKPDATLKQQLSQQKGNNVNPQVQLGNGAKTILKFCEDNGVSFRGHCFVWHSQTPTWLFKEGFNSNGKNVSTSIMDQRLENYIKNVFELVTKSYPNLKIYAWDVVNEAFNEDGSLRSAGDATISAGQSYWYQIYKSDEYIKKAFRYARKYAPKGCKLYYNDYNEYNTAKRDGIYKLVKAMYEEGICDGVGMQSHLDVSYPGKALYEQAIQKYASIGCDIQITELDVTTTSEETQATYYKDLFDIYKKYKDHISAVIFWGINDANNWRAKKTPTIFNRNSEPKAAYYKIIEGMKVSNSTDESGDNKDDKLSEMVFQLSYQYTNGGETVYSTIKKGQVPDKTWTKLSGQMDIPSGAKDIKVYVQTSDNKDESDLIDFYIDDVKVSLPGATLVANKTAEMAGYSLFQNAPNPAVGQTSIQFTLEEAGTVAMALYNGAGIKVMDIVNETLSAGSHSQQINVSSLPSGVYFYEMSVNGFVNRKVMIKK